MKFFVVLRNNLLLFVLLGLSVLVIGVGVFLIVSGGAEPAAPAPLESPSAAEPTLQESLLETEGLIIKASKNSLSPDSAVQDSQRLVRGSEAWCDIMMQKNNHEWSEADTQLFGLKCLN